MLGVFFFFDLDCGEPSAVVCRCARVFAGQARARRNRARRAVAELARAHVVPLVRRRRLCVHGLGAVVRSRRNHERRWRRRRQRRGAPLGRGRGGTRSVEKIVIALYRERRGRRGRQGGAQLGCRRRRRRGKGIVKLLRVIVRAGASRGQRQRAAELLCGCGAEAGGGGAVSAVAGGQRAAEAVVSARCVEGRVDRVRGGRHLAGLVKLADAAGVGAVHGAGRALLVADGAVIVGPHCE